MRIGYPCLNLSLGKERSKTFRLASYSEERLISTVTSNLNYLEDMLRYNIEYGLLNFRIFSGVIPFASHQVNTFDWQNYFRDRFSQLGHLMLDNNFRISLHPDQFTLINSPSEEIFQRTVAELDYHVQLLEAFGLDTSHKVQIHVGGVYGDKTTASQRFIERFALLPKNVQQRLVIENDDRLYSLADCVVISKATGVPILFDTFHHAILNNGESLPEAFNLFTSAWQSDDGLPMIDYSSQAEGRRIGGHTDHIVLDDFASILEQTKEHDFDIMLEIKDKELSALQARDLIALKRPQQLVGRK